MARPRKMTNEQMISVVDSYYATISDGSEKMMKCSLIAEYAIELGYIANGYDFRRNTEVREHIEHLKVNAEINGGELIENAYKTLDITGLIRNNPSISQLTQALNELDAYWKRVYEHSTKISKQNQSLIKENNSNKMQNKDVLALQEQLKKDNSKLSVHNNKLITENRFLRKMLKKYLYPAVANEILAQEGSLSLIEQQATDIAISDFTEPKAPKSLQEAVSSDLSMQSQEEKLLAKMWELCDE